MEDFEKKEGKPPKQEFHALIENPEKLKGLLERSHFYDGSELFNAEGAWKEWARGRNFIASAIDKDGSLLDFGSANGLLLKSIQEWTDHKIDPYGLDTDDQAIRDAKELFPEQETHFATPDELKQRKNFPRDFDFVYWNVWDNYEIKPDDKLFQQLMSGTKSGGRFILGFYDAKEKNEKKIQELIALGFQPSRVLENPNGGDEMIIWFDRDRGPSIGG